MQNKSGLFSKQESTTQFLCRLAIIYATAWLVLAIQPVSRFDWFLENLLVFAFIGLILTTYQKFPLSRFSYFCIFVFLCLHAVGAHYTYSQTPIGYMVQRMFELERNHYDRFVHFCFGVLFVYPIFETLRRYLLQKHTIWSAVLSVCLIMAFSSSYELIEWAAALVLEPEAAMAFMGTQGDVFDSHKDTFLALMGGLIGLVAILMIGRKK